jgi:hypothetical protein
VRREKNISHIFYKIKRVGVRMRKTNNLAAVIARYIPWLGWIGLVNSIYQTARKTQDKYNLIARPQHRIRWTSF